MIFGFTSSPVEFREPYLMEIIKLASEEDYLSKLFMLNLAIIKKLVC